jgi:DNA-binding response OmpR family regulator
MQKYLLILDQNNESLELADEIMYYGYSDVQITSDCNAVYQLAKLSRPDLVILDFSSIDENAKNVCSSFKQDSDFAKIPVIVLSDYISKKVDVNQYSCDAMFLKPYDAEQLAINIQSLVDLKAAV